MTDPTGPEADPAMRRRADLMVGLFVGAVVFLLGGAVVLATSSTGLGIGLIVVGLLVGLGGVVVLRSIPDDERARLTAPKPDADDAR